MTHAPISDSRVAAAENYSEFVYQKLVKNYACLFYRYIDIDQR